MLLNKLMFKFVHHIKAFFRYGNVSYSQEGEDLILNRLFERQKKGFYVDVGAHHPFRFSNTFLFYLKGWRGINIDAMPGSMKLFNKHRKHDINLEIPVLSEANDMIYYQFDEPALNGFSKTLSIERNQNTNYKIINQLELRGMPLAQILKNNIPEKNQQIDFMSIDVEGLDLEVLKSNDWIKFRPNILLVELLNSSMDLINEDPVMIFLKEQKYSVFSKCIKTTIFINDEFKKTLN